MTTRAGEVQALVDASTTEADPRRRVDQLTRALRLLFGEDFPVVPDVGLAPALGAEWRAAWGLGPDADTSILDHQTTTLGRSLPVDDWFTGVARVREKLRSLEGGDPADRGVRHHHAHAAATAAPSPGGPALAGAGVSPTRCPPATRW